MTVPSLQSAEYAPRTIFILKFHCQENKTSQCPQPISVTVIFTSTEKGQGLISGFSSLNDQRNDLSTVVRRFLADYNLCRCDESFSCDVQHTFVNESLNCYRKLDYIVYNSADVVSYNVIESASNLSDYLPLIAVCNCSFVGVRQRSDRCDIVEHLRWDQADLDGYYNETGLYLHSLWLDLKNFECIDATINDAFLS